MKAEVDILMFCLYFKISPTNFLNIRFSNLENTIYIYIYSREKYSEPCERSKIECSIYTKCSILDV